MTSVAVCKSLDNIFTCDINIIYDNKKIKSHKVREYKKYSYVNKTLFNNINKIPISIISKLDLVKRKNINGVVILRFVDNSFNIYYVIYVTKKISKKALIYLDKLSLNNCTFIFGIKSKIEFADNYISHIYRLYKAFHVVKNSYIISIQGENQ